MTIRPIIRYPDPRLALPAQPVAVFDGALRDLASDLLETMHAAPGIGITAPHIGIALRVVVLDLDPIDGARTYVNPEIVARLEVLPFGAKAAAHYGQVRAELARAGTPCGPHDMQIGGHARSEGLIVVTNNMREFSRMPGIRVENWV